MKRDPARPIKIRLDEESVFGLCNSLNAVAGLVREAFPTAARALILAEGTIFALHDKVTEKKVMLVSDLDPMCPLYKVVDEHGWDIGEKSPTFGYMKPEYQKNGRMTGGRRGSFDARFYKGTPPWLKHEVFKIDHLGGGITFHVRKRGDTNDG